MERTGSTTPSSAVGALLRELSTRLPATRVVTAPAQLATYDSDALTSFRARAAVVVLIERADEVAEVVRACARHRVPFVARGSGTSLSGGSLPVEGGVVLALNRLRGVLAVEPDDASATVECGVYNAEVTVRAAPYGLRYAPDPSSGPVCTIGGNVAFNSGGAHCLRYGMTANHVLGLEVVLPDGERDRLGGGLESVGPDLVGAFVGSEGLFGVATQARLRLLPRPERLGTVLAAYERLEAAGEAVARIVAAGMLPGAMEIMDRLAMDAAEASVAAGYPGDAQGLLIVEFEGPDEEVEEDLERAQDLLHASGAYLIRVAADDDERARIWKGRKGAFSAVGRLSPDYLVQDGVVPRTKLGTALAEIARLGRIHGLRVANVFHAGDGNLHPLILFDGREAGALERAERLAGEILHTCVELGGSITGEHGIGVEKRAYLATMYDPASIGLMRRMHRAVDEAGVANPGKMLPPSAAAAVEPAAPPSGQHARLRGGASPWGARAGPEVAALQELLASRQRVHVVGGGSKSALSSGATLRLDDLRGVLEYDPAEYTVTVLAGTPMAQLRDVVAEHGQELPFDPPLVEAGATVGGTVAAGLSGPGRYRYGGVRDFLLAVRFVSGTGELVTGGAKVVKNAAGFDLPKLMVGSLGALGVLVECTFKVFPRPEEYVTLRFDLPDLAAALDVMRRAARGPWELTCLELEPPATVWMRLGGRARALPGRLERLQRDVGARGDLLTGGRDAAVWRDAREFAFVPPGHALVKVPIAPSRLPEMEEAVARQRHEVPRRYGVGGSVAHLAWPDALGEGALDALLRRHRLSALALTGSWRVPLKRAAPMGPFEVRLRRALDPHGLLGGAAGSRPARAGAGGGRVRDAA